jgi:hypothetical protein
LVSAGVEANEVAGDMETAQDAVIAGAEWDGATAAITAAEGASDDRCI